MRHPVVAVKVGVLRRVGSGSHARCESLRKGEDLLGSRSVTPLSSFRLKPLLKSGNHSRREAFARELGKLRREQVGLGILQVQTLQNSTSKG